MPNRWQVLKFGGTTVARAEHWKAMALLAKRRSCDGGRVVLVCSALAGVTSRLMKMIPDDPGAEAQLSELIERHRALALDLDLHDSELINEFNSWIETAWNTLCTDPSPANRAALVAIGEQMSTRLGYEYLSKTLDCDLVQAAPVLHAISEPDDRDRTWLSAHCASGEDKQLQAQWAALPPVLITQGYVASNRDGRTVLLGRGGSDTSAALLAGKLAAEEVEIWTDVPGVFSANPGDISEARLIRSLDYAEALEMAAGGARVVDPRCIRAAAEQQVTIRIRDLEYPNSEGTKISSSAGWNANHHHGVKAVSCQHDMLVVLLENLDIRRQVGFLSWVFGQVSELGISVDLVTTSETTTTLAINGVDNHLDDAAIKALNERLSTRCKVKLYPGASCINLIGRGIRMAVPGLAVAEKQFREWPLLMLSYSANDLCLSLLVYPDQAASLQQVLHESLITMGALNDNPDVYGPSWSEFSS